VSWNWTSSRGTKTSLIGVPGENARVPWILILMSAVPLALAACDVGSAPTDRSGLTVASTAISGPTVTPAPTLIPETVTTASAGPTSTPPPGSPSSTLSFDEQQTMLLDAYRAMGVEPCCQDDPGVGIVVELGFVYEGGKMFVTAGPAQFLATSDRLAEVPVQDGLVRFSVDGRVALFECGLSIDHRADVYRPR
jgi:hypothetical protein